MGMLAGDAQTVNSRGDTLNAKDFSTLAGTPGHNIFGSTGLEGGLAQTNPSKAAEMWLNWLTAGGPPKPIDPSLDFAAGAKLAPVRERALSGMGMSGLFGFSKFMGMLKPAGMPSTPGVSSIPPISRRA